MLRFLAIDVIRDFIHRRIEPQIFVGIFSLIMPLRRLYSNDDLVRMYFFDRAFLVCSIDEDSIAGL